MMETGRESRTALVTGASHGIGKAIALKLVDAGFHTIAIGRNRQSLDELSANSNIKPLVLDLTDRSALRSALENLTVDVIVNNAGMIPKPAPFVEMDQTEIDATLDLNLNAVCETVRLLLPTMIKRCSGHLIFTGSIAGHAPFPNMAVYGASKAAIASFAASLRCDLAGTGIRVTEIVAGRVETNLYRGVYDDRTVDDMYADTQPVQPQHVAEMVATVLSMPAHVNVTRFDILPTAQYVGGGSYLTPDKQ